MKPSAAFVTACLAAVACALPANKNDCSSSSDKPFYLVTTTQREKSEDPAALDSVSATSLFDPYYQPNYLLRTIDAGAVSYPNFTLTDGTLHTYASPPHSSEDVPFNSIDAVEGDELQFYAKEEGKGNLGLKGGYLLAVGGKAVGWQLCPGDFGETVVSSSRSYTCSIWLLVPLSYGQFHR